MDVRSIEDVEPIVEHNGTVPVWWLVSSREMKEITEAAISSWSTSSRWPVGARSFPHSHPTHEFYYVMSGRGIMTIEDEDREIRQGDLVHILRTRSTASGRCRTMRPSTASASRSA